MSKGYFKIEIKEVETNEESTGYEATVESRKIRKNHVARALASAILTFAKSTGCKAEFMTMFTMELMMQDNDI